MMQRKQQRGSINPTPKKMKANNSMKKSIHQVTMVTMLVMLLGSLAYAVPTPHGIEGTIYELDGITPIKVPVDIAITNLDNSKTVAGKTGQGSAAEYKASISGENGDNILITVSNQYHSSNRTIVLQGIMKHVNLVLNMSLPELPPVIQAIPPQTAMVSEPFVYQIIASDPNEDQLAYSLLQGPGGMTILPDGLITWHPSRTSKGNQTIIVSISDGVHTTQASFTIETMLPNNQEEIEEPLIETAPQQNVRRGSGGSGGGGASFSPQVPPPGVTESSTRPRGIPSPGVEVRGYWHNSHQVPATLPVSNYYTAEATLLWLNKTTWQAYGHVPQDTTSLTGFVVHHEGWFALAAKEAATHDKWDIVSSTIYAPYLVRGTVYLYPEQEIRPGTLVTIHNRNTSVRVFTQTGRGPSDGSFEAMVPGSEDDEIIINASGTVVETQLKDIPDMKIIKYRYGHGQAITGMIATDVTHDPSYYGILFGLILTLIIIFIIRFKKINT